MASVRADVEDAARDACEQLLSAETVRRYLDVCVEGLLPQIEQAMAIQRAYDQPPEVAPDARSATIQQTVESEKPADARGAARRRVAVMFYGLLPRPRFRCNGNL